MRRKRLKHATDILCHMFCGWRLINCKPDLVKLGSGTITIDALSGHCEFNEASIPELSIATEIKLWLREDMERNRIPLESLVRATLKATLTFDEIAWRERTGTDQFYSENAPVYTERMHRCIINCKSEVVTDDTVYSSHYKDLQEWPIGWPSA